MRSLLLALFCFLAAPAWSQTTLSARLPPLAVQIANGAKISYASNGTPLASMARSYAMGPITGNVVATEAGLLATPGGQAAVGVARTVAWGGIAAGIAAVGAAGYAGFQVGAPLALAMGYTDFSVGNTRCAATLSGWQCDPGGPTSTFTTYTLVFGTQTLTGSSKQEVCAKYGTLAAANSLAGLRAQYPPANNCSVTSGYDFELIDVSGQCRMHRRETYQCGANPLAVKLDDHPTLAPSALTGPGCPASIDALNPAYSISAGSQPDADGKCKTGRYNSQPETYVAPRIEQYADKTKAPQVVPVLLPAGVELPAGPAAVTGPATKVQPQTTSTTTNPLGTTTTTTTPTYNYRYDGDTITWNVTNITYTTNPDGTTSTGTTTAPAEDKPDECVTFPDRVGCSTMGEPPSPEALPSSTVNVTFAPDSGWGADNGTCPALVHTRSLGDVDVFGLFCTYMAGIRFAVIGCAWLLAAFIFVGKTE